MAEKQSVPERFAQWVKNNHDRQPSLGAELSAIAREAVKDIRGAIHESVFGQRETPGEPGAPLNPTMQEVTNDRQTLGDYHEVLDQHAARESASGEDRGMDR